MVNKRFERPALLLNRGGVSLEPAPTAGTAEPAIEDGPGVGGSRRGALQAAGIALLAALGVRDGAAKQNRARSEQHRNRKGHDHGKRGKRGKAGAGGQPGGPGSPGDKGDKGDQGTQGTQGDPGPQGPQGPGTMLTVTTSWNPGSLFPGDSRSTFVDVPGAAAGDPVMVGLSSIGQFSIHIVALPI